jgi:hypothetical protein
MIALSSLVESWNDGYYKSIGGRDDRIGRKERHSPYLPSLQQGNPESFGTTVEIHAGQTLHLFLPPLPQGTGALSPQGLLDGLTDRMMDE